MTPASAGRFYIRYAIQRWDDAKWFIGSFVVVLLGLTAYSIVVHRSSLTFLAIGSGVPGGPISANQPSARIIPGSVSAMVGVSGRFGRRFAEPRQQPFLCIDKDLIDRLAHVGMKKTVN